MPIRIFPCAVNLPLRLADELAANETGDFSDVVVGLPSHRLANYVRLALAKRVSACVPPRLCTLDELAGLIPPPLRLRPVSKIEQALVLTELLRPHRFQYIRRGMEDDIARFFDELVDEGLLPGVFRGIRELLHRDEFKDERHVERLEQQVGELESLHNMYQVFLDAHGLTDAARDAASRVKSLAEGTLFTQRTGLRRIYLIGFADATRVQKLLLKHLLSQCAAQFWTHAEPAFLLDHKKSSSDWRQRLNPFAPLAELLNSVGETGMVIDKPDAEILNANSDVLRAAYVVPENGDSHAGIPPGARVCLHEATTPLSEVKAAAALIRRLVHDQGVAPHRIVVVVPDEGAYGRMVWSVFAEAGVQTNNSLGQPLQRTRAGMWLHLLMALVKEDWRLADLISFLHHPFSEMWMRTRARESLRAAQTPLSTIQRLIENCLFDDEIARGRVRVLEAIGKVQRGEPQECAAAADTLTALSEALAPLATVARDGQLRMKEWTERLVQVLERLEFLRWIAATGGGAYNLDGQASQAVISTMQEIRRVGDLLQETLRFGDFFRLLNQQLFAVAVRPTGEPHSGVQVMGLLESRAVPGAVFVVVGNNEGSFPAAPGRERFLEEPLRAQLGLMTYQKRELLQDMNFYRLVAGAPNAHLFYSRTHYDTPRVRSRFLERLLLLNERAPETVRVLRESGRLFESDFVLDREAQNARESLRTRLRLLQSRMEKRYDLRGNFPGPRAELLAHFSATTLQMLLLCPYRFLLHALRIDQRELPEDEANSLVLGKWLHQVFQLFFQGIADTSLSLTAENEDLRQPWTSAITPALREAAASRLQRLGRILMTPHEGQEHLYYHMLCVGWPAFIDEEIKRGAGVFQPDYFEFNLDDALKEPLAIGSHKVSVGGRVDRIFVTDNEIRLIDYKLSGFKGSQKSILSADEPQLPLYALALQKTGMFPSTAKWTGEFWSIRRGDSKVVFDGREADLTVALTNLANRWRQRLDELNSGARFEAEETPFCKHCHYSGVCRREELFYREHEAGKSESRSHAPEDSADD